MSEATSVQVFVPRLDDEKALAVIAAITETDQIAELHQHLEYVIKHGKKLKDALEDRMLQLITETGQEISWPVNSEGDKRRFWKGFSKPATKCINPRALLNYFFEKLSVEDLEACLSANCFKHGAFRKLLKTYNLEADFDTFFETTKAPRLESDGPEEKTLQSIDERFLT